MKTRLRIIHGTALLIALLLGSCLRPDHNPVSNKATEHAQLELSLQVQAPGSTGLRKTSALTGDSLRVVVIDNGTVITGHTRPTTQTGAITFDTLPALKTLGIFAWIDDTGGVSHKIADTIFVALSPGSDSSISAILYSLRSMLRGTVAPLIDGISRVLVMVDGTVEVDTAVTPDIDTLRFSANCLAASPGGTINTLSIVVRGDIWGNTDTVLYRLDTALTVVSGVVSTINVRLPYVGPGPVPATLILNLAVQQSGTTDLQIELESPVLYKLSVSTGLYTGPGENPNTGTHYLSKEQIRLRLRPGVGYIDTLRFYTSRLGLEHAPAIALSMGYKAVYGSAWISRDAAINQLEIDSLVAIANCGVLYRVIVGNEVLLRGDQSAAQLIDHIRYVKSRVSVQVGYSDIADNLLNPSNYPLIAECDFVAVNIYPYWEGISIDRAMYHFNKKFSRLKHVTDSVGVDLVVGEAGWRSYGPVRNQAVPSLANAIRYNLELLTWKRRNKVPVLVFAMLDEKWKEPFDGGWELWDTAGALKQGYLQLFQGIDVADTWTDTILIGGSGTPSLEFFQVPPLGSTQNVIVRVSHVRPSTHTLVAYIKVGGWWIKPYANNYHSLIYPDGLSQEIDVTTGGNDTQASAIRVYLVNDNPPATIPISLGNSSPPVIEAAVAMVEIVR